MILFSVRDEQIKIKQATSEGHIWLDVGNTAVDLSFPTSKTRRGRVIDNGHISPTITCAGGIFVTERITDMAELIKKIADEVFQRIRKQFRIRKLSVYEVFILQGMTKEDVEKCKAVGVSNSQLYKIAGNGLSTNCPQFLLERLWKSQINENYKTTDEICAEKYGEI